ncbi:hypothetical protein ABC304_02980 [Microbacterium sp. 1P10UB]|uniref:hypothetical protein n=1 Tax=unclassified Microbacterium TaxID=2609290 RepID=UPI00399F0D4D
MLELDADRRGQVSLTRSLLGGATRLVKSRVRSTAVHRPILHWTMGDGDHGIASTPGGVVMPLELVLTNGSRPIVKEIALLQVTVSRPVTSAPGVGAARGFAVERWNGERVAASARTVAYRSAPVIGRHGFPATTFTTTSVLDVAAHETVTLPVEFGTVGVGSAATDAESVVFPVAAVLTVAGRSLRVTTSITVPPRTGTL